MLWQGGVEYTLTSSPASLKFTMRLRKRFFIPDVCENGEGSTKIAMRRGDAEEAVAPRLVEASAEEAVSASLDISTALRRSASLRCPRSLSSAGRAALLDRLLIQLPRTPLARRWDPGLHARLMGRATGTPSTNIR